MSFTIVVVSLFIAGGILCAILYDYLRREQRKMVPQKQDEAYSGHDAASAKHIRPIIITGLIVMGLHFVITSLLDRTSYALEFTLGAPATIVSFFIYPSFVPNFVFRLFSSFVYGCIGALLATGKSHLRLIGVTLIGALIFLAALLSIVDYMFAA